MGHGDDKILGGDRCIRYRGRGIDLVKVCLVHPHLTDRNCALLRGPSGSRSRALQGSCQSYVRGPDGPAKPSSGHLVIGPFDVRGHSVGSCAEAQEGGNGRSLPPPGGAAPSWDKKPITFGGWFPEFSCDHASIHRFYLVEVNFVRITDRRGGRSHGPGTKAAMGVTAALAFSFRGRGGGDQSPDTSGMGGE